MKSVKLLLLSLILLAFSIEFAEAKKSEPYQADWESLKQYEVPEWYRDCKFGIYFHWGPYSVPAFKTEWYSLWMYRENHVISKYHEMVYGGTKKFGYKDFIPMFKGEKFNADEWAKLFKDAGAQFAGPCAEHADGFAMWDSKVAEWNAKNMGPERDVVGEMQRAVKKQGMKYMVSFHRHWLYAWYPTYDKSVDAGDPKYSGLYGPYAPEGSFVMGQRGFNAELMAPDSFGKDWLDRLHELMYDYDPDIIWFDNRMNLIDEKYRKQFLTDYYNKGIERGKEVVCTYKFNDLVEGTAVLDLERARMSELKEFTWLTDDSVDWGAWCNVSTPRYKDTNRLLDFLIDVVSKNGAVLLNVTPTANGVIPFEVEKRLREMGAWLKLNGEAIYDTRPWVIYGEGPQKIKEGHLSEHKNADATAEDIRFTVNGKQLYATILDWADSGKVVIRSLSTKEKHLTEPVTKVSMIGSKEKLRWEQTAEGLVVYLPNEKPCDHAFVLKIN
ncbi:MAG: alpha-L-fucosidase [Rikenellaceae bacterium]